MEAGCDLVDRVIDFERDFTTLSCRALSTHALLALHLLSSLTSAPCLSPGSSGGKAYTRLSYRTLDGHGKALYLGNLTPLDEYLLRDQIARRWPIRRHELCRIVRILRAHRRQAQRKAHALAARCGYSFRGWMLHRRIS